MKWDLDLCSEFLYQTGESPERKRIVAAESGPQEEIKPPEDGDEQPFEKEPMESSSRQQVSSGPVGVAPKSSLSGGKGKQAVSPDSQKGQRVSFAESFQSFFRKPDVVLLVKVGWMHRAVDTMLSVNVVGRPLKHRMVQSQPLHLVPLRKCIRRPLQRSLLDAPVDGGTSTQRQELDTRVDVDGDTNMPEVELGSPTPVGDMDSSSVGG